MRTNFGMSNYLRRARRGEYACQIGLICVPLPMSAKDLMPAPNG